MASLEVGDTDIYDGIQLIISKFPDALMYSQLGCLFIPEALDSEFTQIEIDALLALNWQIDKVNGGWKYNVTGYEEESSIGGAPIPSIPPTNDEEILIYDLAASSWEYGKVRTLQGRPITTEVPNDGEVLIYSSSFGGWVHSEISSIRGKTIETGSPENEEVLIYNSSSSTWEYGQVRTIQGIPIEAGTPINEEVLMYNSSSGFWEYTEIPPPTIRQGTTVDSTITRWYGNDSQQVQGSGVTLSSNGSLINVRTVLFSIWPVYLVASSGSALINFASYQYATVNLNNKAVVTITIYTPLGYGNFKLKLIQGGTTVSTVSWATQDGKTIHVPVGGLDINNGLGTVTLIDCVYDGNWGLVATPMELLS